MTAMLERNWFAEAVADGALDDITIGSLCTGYGGLGSAVRSVIGGRHVWVADNDPDAAALLAYRYPDLPNLGDITQVDWNTVPLVDVLEFGFPCTDLSCAGERAGLREGTRSGIWANCFEAITVLRPSLVVVENVRNIVSIHADSDLEPCAGCMGDGSADTVLRALGAVLGDLASIGFDAEWRCVRASDAGAPHKRDRIFILAWPAADAELDGLQGGGSAAGAYEGREAAPALGRGSAAGDLGSPADTDGEEERRGERPSRRHEPGRRPAGDNPAPPAGGGRPPADPLSPGLEVGTVEHDGPQRPPAERGGGELPGPDAGIAAPPCPYVVGCDVIDEACPGEPGRWHIWTGYCTTNPHGLCAGDTSDPARIDLLKTPTAQLAVNGGSQHPDKRRAGGHGPTLADQVEHEVALLPTPTSTLGSNADAISQAKGREGGTLVEALSLLPTPTVADSRNTRNAMAGRTEGSAAHSGTTLSDVFHNPLLPTPCVADADGTRASRGEDRSGELLLTGIARKVAVGVDWGKYEAAIRRWEQVFGVPAPCPVRPGKTNYVLAPELPEWMMGLPPGWVTAVPGLTRTAMLKLIGNGVVPQQGALGVRALLDAIDWLPLRNLLAARALSNYPDPEKEAIA